MKSIRLFTTIVLLLYIGTTLTASSRDDLMQSINMGDFPLAFDLISKTTWQYEIKDEYILDFDKYFQFYTFCTNQNASRYALDIISNYWAQLSIQIGIRHKSNNNLDQSEQWLSEAVSVSESLSMPQYAIQKCISYNQLGNFYYEKTTNYIWAFNCYKLADSIWCANNIPADDLYWTIIQNKANACELAARFYRNNEDWQSARYYYAYEAFELKRLNGDKDAQYALALNREAIMTSNLKDYNATDSLLTISRRVLEIPGVDKDSSYTYVWNNLMGNYFALQDYKRILKECDILEKHQNTPYVEKETFMYWKVVALCNIALQKEREEKYEDAEHLLVQANEIDTERKKLVNAQDTGFGNISDWLVRVRYAKEHRNNITTNANSLDELNFLLKQNQKNATTIFCLFRTADYFRKIENLMEAYQCYQMVYDILKENPNLWDEINDDCKTEYYVDILSLFCPQVPALFNDSDIQKGTEYVTAKYGTQSTFYFNYLSSVASYYTYQKQPDKAKELYSKIINEINELLKIKKIKKEEIQSYGHSLCSATCFLSDYYLYEKNDTEKAWLILNHFSKKKEFIQYATSSFFYSWIYLCYDIKMYGRIWEMLPYYYSFAEKSGSSAIDMQTTDEQVDWYHQTYLFCPDQEIVLATKYVDTIPTATIEAICNHEIFKKGILLRASTDIVKYLENSKDKVATQLYDEMQTQKKQLLVMQNDSNTSDSILWELSHSINRKERLLSSLSGKYIRKNKNADITWKDIQYNLKANEVAIEFINYGMIDQYWALLIRKGYKYPRLVYLKDFVNIPESEKQFKISLWEQYASINTEIGIPYPEFLEFTGNASSVYKVGANGTKLYELLWCPLRAYINEGETIYFSPSGVLHQVAIESLPYDSVSTMSDHFNMVRLSSTRELVLHKHEEHKGSATLYGGIQYDVDTTDLLAESRLYEQTPLLASRGIDIDTTNRGSVKYLFGTKKEAESIERILSKHNVSATLYTSVAANEESFKTLSGKHQKIIHIGTHGFYWADSTARKQDFFTQRSMSLSEDKPIQYAIDPLDRCGLLFAGANIALSGHSKDLPDGVQDGILTAKEISLMDLRDCDLVVLSACETAKGDITSEGVFGLQRAFKMAGVQTIIMSLWKVNDDATQMLMTEFYTNWIEKKQSKREAFRNAQNAVRCAVDEDGDRMFASPYFWAGFIMLD